MARINLYNYRGQELFYKKLRVYFFVALAVILSLLINLLVYIYFQIRIVSQHTRNSFLITSINILDNRLKPVRDFNSRVNDLNQKLKLINQVESQRDNLVAFFQKFDKTVPNNIYFTTLKLKESQLELTGASSSPLYIADFLDKLRNENGIFYSPTLKTNSTNDGNLYNFAINVYVKPDLEAEVSGGNK